ncbi:MAG: hypothetical protein HQM15_09230 [Deltaproteobacteria bacterium]|nr:hypothetical protein [Deltaproteobacteria bacterium]
MIHSELSKVSLRIPKTIIKSITQIYPKDSLSEIIRMTLLQEIERKKVMKEHLKRYGKFKPEHFDESIL